MKHKKTVTDSVLAANRANAKFSTGPKTEEGKSNSGRNAFRHGILARKIVLATETERSAFKRLFQQCQDDFRPEGMLEKVVMEEIVISIWKVRITTGLEMRELVLRQEDPRDQISGVFEGNLKLPVDEWDLPLDKSWDCERVTIRAVAGEDKNSSTGSRGPTVYQGKVLETLKQWSNYDSQTAGHIEVEAVLGSCLDRLSRYQSALKRDLYKAMDTLRSLQTERRERDVQ